MTRRIPFAAVAGACLTTALALPSRAQTGTPPSAALQAHLDSARALAGSDVSPALSTVLCGDPKALPAFLAPIVATSKAMPATKAFDQLYYLGMDFVGAWALTTRDGIILFDALDDAREAEQVIDGGLRSLGLDPAQIKYVVVMHGHGDHYGGAKYLQDKYRAKVLMSAEDWAFAPGWLADYAKASAAAAARFGPIPGQDGAIQDGQRLTLGGTTVTFYVTPGHTPGTLTAIIPVTDGGVPHTVSFWGGTALPPDLAGKQQYERSLERVVKLVDAAKVDAVISNHPFIDGTKDKVVRIGARKSGEANPFVIGHDAVMRYMGVHLQCTRAAELR
jgi:metallo-beta-lactamase class B